MKASRQEDSMPNKQWPSKRCKTGGEGEATRTSIFILRQLADSKLHPTFHGRGLSAMVSHAVRPSLAGVSKDTDDTPFGDLAEGARDGMPIGPSGISPSHSINLGRALRRQCHDTLYCIQVRLWAMCERHRVRLYKVSCRGGVDSRLAEANLAAGSKIGK